MANRKRQVKELIAKAGLALADGIEQANSGHLKARTVRPDGSTRLFTFALTPSDARSDLNALSLMRRFARGL